jgi:phosphopantothenoylcysteine decarboxylase/phosphopantothenate--cysteine ligase
MNPRMWEHPATRRNVERLRADGARFIGPASGEMACGEEGEGRMAEPEEIAARVEELLRGENDGRERPLAGRHVLITAGPTVEPIDPVRVLANRSSGRMGYALAEAARDLGAEVTLVSGPVALAPPAGVRLVAVETARQMLDAVRAALPADMAVFAAAVADWRAKNASAAKMKKNASGPPVLELEENPDILATIAAAPERPPLLVGFAAETENVLENARAKLTRKGADVIVANDVSPETGILGGEETELHLVLPDGVEHLPRQSKHDAARALMRRLAALLREKTAGRA